MGKQNNGDTGMKALDKNRMILFIKQHMEIWVLLFATGLISISLLFVKEEQEIVIRKEGYGGDSRQIGFILQKEKSTEAVTLELRARELTEKQAKNLMKKAFAYLDSHIKGENASLSRIVNDLDLSLDYETFPFDLEIEPNPYLLIEQDGRVMNKRDELKILGYTKEQQKQGIPVVLKIVLRYGEYQQEKEYNLTVFPREESALEKQFSEVKEVMEKEEQAALYKEELVLPAVIDGVQIARADDTKGKPVHVLLVGFLVAGLLLLREQENKRAEEKKRQERLLKSYPWFVNEVVLLLGAGMQMKAVMAALINEHSGGDPGEKIKRADDRSILIDELKKSYHSLELGMPEEQVYYQLGRRLKLSCYIKLMTLLEQNVKRGSKGLSATFEQEETNALEERKNLAKRYGEEAGTKLLGPMLLLLIVVMLIIMIPAFMSF